ncbi:cupin [Tepiditoga spiralis]|uniref:Cupin n=1 Tax=Tepiditoga spiralis TaxID=2108365 RepID=A0A7G1G5H3_9BACT|nr:cupin domain-containing protein [Tepiditoga spiralis]BBE30033.1 cupin [Tepiditoga spiralis]
MKKATVGKAYDIEPLFINNDTVKNVKKRVLIGSKLGAPNFVMRLFTVAPNGNSPKHSHHWEHEIFILKGKANVFNGEEYQVVEAGNYIFVPGNVEHQLINIGEDDLEFICVIPNSADEE